jgi:hypothetical protein
VEPSEISANAERFILLIDRTNPWIVVSSSSGMLLLPLTDESSSFAQVIGLRPGTLAVALSFKNEVEKVRRHARMVYPDLDATYWHG